MEAVLEETSSTSDASLLSGSMESIPCPVYWPVGYKNTFKLVQRILVGEVDNDATAARSLHSLVRKQLATAARDGFRETAGLLYPETGEQANFELLVETVLLRRMVEGALEDTDAREELALLVDNWIELPGLTEDVERFLRYLRPRIWKPAKA